MYSRRLDTNERTYIVNEGVNIQKSREKEEIKKKQTKYSYMLGLEATGRIVNGIIINNENVSIKFWNSVDAAPVTTTVAVTAHYY